MDSFKRIKSYKIATSDAQVLHVEETGFPDGIPALFLHGGPGAGIGHNYHWPFNGLNYRLIAFDQRGCGRSQPFGCLKNNTIGQLIEDIEHLRKHFGVEKWLLFGGSWGTTLALCYAIKHPNRVSGMVLRGVFLGRDQDADWFISAQGGAAQVFYEEYKRFIGNYKAQNSKEVCEAFYADLTHADKSIRLEAAARWFDWEGKISRLLEGQEKASDFASTQQVYTLALFECHYILNHCFFDNDFIIKNCDLLKHIPVEIVHGRYDMVCKCESAVLLSNNLPLSNMTIVEDAGHSMTESGIGLALIQALRKMESQLCVD